VFWVAAVQVAQDLPEQSSLWVAVQEAMVLLPLSWPQLGLLILAMVEAEGRLRKIKAQMVGRVLLYCHIYPIIIEIVRMWRHLQRLCLDLKTININTPIIR
jgi:hypothetical protein